MTAHVANDALVGLGPCVAVHTHTFPPESPLFAKGERGLISDFLRSVIIILYLHDLLKLCGTDVLLITSLEGLIKGTLLEMCVELGESNDVGK